MWILYIYIFICTHIVTYSLLCCLVGSGSSGIIAAQINILSRSIETFIGTQNALMGLFLLQFRHALAKLRSHLAIGTRLQSCHPCSHGCIHTCSKSSALALRSKAFTCAFKSFIRTRIWKLHSQRRSQPIPVCFSANLPSLEMKLFKAWNLLFMPNRWTGTAFFPFLCTRLCLRSKILQIKWDYKRYDAITCIYNMSYVFISIYIHYPWLGRSVRKQLSIRTQYIRNTNVE